MNTRTIARAAAVLGMACLLGNRAATASVQMTLSPDGEKVAVPFGAKTLRVLDAEGGLIIDVSLDSQLSDLSFSPDSARLAACTAKGGLILIDLGAKQAKTLQEPTGQKCSDLAWNSKKGRLYFLLVNDEPGQPGAAIAVKYVDLASGALKVAHAAKAEAPAYAPPAAPVVVKDHSLHTQGDGTPPAMDMAAPRPAPLLLPAEVKPASPTARLPSDVSAPPPQPVPPQPSNEPKSKGVPGTAPAQSNSARPLTKP